MEIEEYDRIAAAEDEHWWYLSTRALMHELLAPWLTNHPHILEAGCGPGGHGASFAALGSVVGVDVSPHALAYVRARHPDTVPVQASLEDMPFEDDTFDIVFAITVLYTVPDDIGALHELARVVRPGGALLLVEPAFESLGRRHDAIVHGRRRYRKRQLSQRVEDAGFHIRRATYAYSFLAPPAAILGAYARLRHRRDKPGSSDMDKRALDHIFAPLATANVIGSHTTICLGVLRW